MVHVATVHWQSDRWIDLQLRYLDRFLGDEYRVYAFLNEVPGDHEHKFFYSSAEPIKDHATKLNLLGDVISYAAEDAADRVLFLDGDAFPVGAVAPLVAERLDAHKLIAVQRYENNGDRQPHPCFCITTVGFWREIGGDWHRGHEWLDLTGHPVTDVGGNLLAALESRGIDWHPLQRINRREVHPLFFGVYGDGAGRPIVYHHGAGFRDAPGGRVSRVLYGERDLKARRMTRLFDRLPRRGVLGMFRRRYHPVKRLRRRIMEEHLPASEEIMQRIERDEEPWRELV